MATTLSVLVVAFNEAEALPLQAAALDALEMPEGIELERILIDGGSHDGSAELAGTLGYRVVVLPGASIPVCRNRALAEAGGEWIAFLDADCTPCPSWLAEAALFLREDAPVMLGWPVVPPENGSWVQQAWHVHWSNKNPVTEVYRGRNVIRRQAFRLMATRNMLFNREVAERLSGFDEALPTGEDTDFALRASEAGILILAVEGLHVVHHGEPENLRAFFRQQLWHANRSAYLKILKESGGRTGGNAPLFTLLFLICSLVSLAALFPSTPTVLVLTLPGLLGALALRTAMKAGRPSVFPALMLLYGCYGLARSMDLLGLGRNKKSWKREGRT